MELVTQQLAHFVDEPSNLASWLLDPTASQAVSDAEQNEARAYVDEYIGDQQIGIPMTIGPNTSNQSLQTIFAGIATRDGGYSTSAFKSDGISAAASWVAAAHPANAPDIIFPEYVQDSWAIAVSGQSDAAINWQQVVAGQISLKQTGNTITITTNSPLPLLGTTNTLNMSGTLNTTTGAAIATQTQLKSGSTVLRTTTDVQQTGGSQLITLTGQAPVSGGNHSIVVLSTSNATSFEGNGNTIGPARDADSSSITVSGTDTGDIVHGNGNTGSRTNWGGYVAASGTYGGYSGGGYYGGTKASVRARSGVLQASRAPLADIAAIGSADQLVHTMAGWSPATAAVNPALGRSLSNTALSDLNEHPHSLVATHLTRAA